MRNLLVYWIESLVDIRHRHSTYTIVGITWIQHLPNWFKAIAEEIRHITFDLDDRFEYCMGLIWGYHYYKDSSLNTLTRFEKTFDKAFHYVLYRHRDKRHGFKFEL